ncbi:MAG: hypothetical protein HY716_00865 [Planctomycetes bacterium]|nr:hypothetical protein [Planctomycetota bacterium]
MLVKKSVKNQVALPKALLDRAGVGPEDVYFDAEYERGAIVLRPVEIEAKIPPEVLERFKSDVLKGHPGDRRFRSMEALIKDLKRKR